MSGDERDRWLEQLRTTASTSQKDWHRAFRLSVFFGYLGADRYYLEQVGLASLKLITLGGYGIWWLADILSLARGTMRDARGGVVRYTGHLHNPGATAATCVAAIVGAIVGWAVGLTIGQLLSEIAGHTDILASTAGGLGILVGTIATVTYARFALRHRNSTESKSTIPK